MRVHNGRTGCTVSPETITVVFVVFKLTHVIDWEWWWVLSPVWITLILVMLFGTTEDE